MPTNFTVLVYCLTVAFLSSLVPLPALAQRDLKDIPLPDPEEERRTFILPDGFEVNLFAADPQIAKPIQMNFDPQGRLWVCSSETYPQIEPGKAANDRILILHDKNGDGTSDETIVFADGLLIPTGIAPGDGGVYVGASTELLHLRDTSGDGRADKRSVQEQESPPRSQRGPRGFRVQKKPSPTDERRVVLSGFGTEDTHHIIHTLRWGPEARLYFSQSIYIHSHVETPWGVRRLNAGGIWRFRPESLHLDVFARGLINTWGTDFDANGTTFATDGAGGEGINYMVPGASYATARGAERILPGLNPGSPKHCGLEIVESEHLPADWQGSMLTNDFRGHRVCRFTVTEEGAGFRSREQQEVIRSDHVAFRPVDVKIGPDGAIYIADWYNPIIQHGEVDFRDPRRDRVHGRIWRVTYRGEGSGTGASRSPTDFTTLSTGELLEQLKSPNKYDRQQTKQVLRERRQGSGVREELNRWVAGLEDDLAADRGRLEALWVTQAWDAVDVKLLDRCLESGDPGVRGAATRVLGDSIDRVEEPLARLGRRVGDAHPRVRLEAVRALARVKRPEAAAVAMQALDHDVDRWLEYALWLTARELQPYWGPALLAGKLDFTDRTDHLTFLLKSAGSPEAVPVLVELVESAALGGKELDDVLQVIGQFGTAEHLGVLFDLALAEVTDRQTRTGILRQLESAAAARKVHPARDLSAIAPLLESAEGQLWSAVARCIGHWQVESLRGRIVDEAAGSSRGLSERTAAVEALAHYGDDPAAEVLMQIIQAADEDLLRRSAIAALLPLRPRRAAELAAAHLQNLGQPEESAPLFEVFLQRKGGGDLLAEVLRQRSLPKDVAVIGTRIVTSSGQGESSLAKVLRKAGDLEQGAVTLSQSEMAALVREIEQRGDPARGERIFRRRDLSCFKCHAIGPAGGEIGPNLLSLGASSQMDYVVESLLDPDAKIKEGFETLVVATDAGEILSGLRVRQSDSELVLRDAEGRERAIPLESIQARREGASLMPAGLMSQLTHQELVDLSAFLGALGRSPEYTLGTAPVARHWDVMQPTQQAAHHLRRTSYAAAATDEPAFEWQRVYGSVRGELSLNELPEVRVRDRIADGYRGMSFARTRFSLSRPGPVSFELNDPRGLQIWVNETPVEPGNLIRFDLPAGRHRLTFAVDRSERTAPLSVKPLTTTGSEIVDLPSGP